jgi:hypothetical protein
MDKVGNQYLHLVLPANKINFLNGLESNENSSFFNQKSETDEKLGYHDNS